METQSREVNRPKPAFCFLTDFDTHRGHRSFVSLSLEIRMALPKGVRRLRCYAKRLDNIQVTSCSVYPRTADNYIAWIRSAQIAVQRICGKSGARTPSRRCESDESFMKWVFVTDCIEKTCQDVPISRSYPSGRLFCAWLLLASASELRGWAPPEIAF